MQGAGDDVRTWRDEWSLAQRRLDKGAARQTLTASLPTPEAPLQAHGKELLRIMHNVKAKRQQASPSIDVLDTQDLAPAGTRQGAAAQLGLQAPPGQPVPDHSKQPFQRCSLLCVMHPVKANCLRASLYTSTGDQKQPSTVLQCSAQLADCQPHKLLCLVAPSLATDKNALAVAGGAAGLCRAEPYAGSS